MNLFRQYFVFLLLTCVSQTVRGQNLVKNPGFEEFDSAKAVSATPLNFDFGESSFEHVKSWYNPTYGCPAYYCTKSGYYDAQKKWTGDSMRPHAGNAYSGFWSYWTFPEREYIGGQLVKPLEAGKTYKFSVYIARNDQSNYTCDQLGVFFSDTCKRRVRTNGVIKEYTPQLIINTQQNCKKLNVWEEVSGYYTASGGERFFILGNFKRTPGDNDTISAPPIPNRQVYYPPAGTPLFYCYYFVDDVSLVALDKKSIPKDTLGIVPGKKLVLTSIKFSMNDSTLDPSSYPVLNDIATSMKKQPGLKVEISGHTENSANAVSNQHLSEARARVVARYLIRQGIVSKRITTKGYGSSKPVSTTDQSKNRRVEFLFSQ